MENKLSRRRVAVAGLALAVTTPNVAHAQADERVIRLEAPDDVYVEHIQAEEGAVALGQTLIVLKSYRLLHLNDHLTKLRQHIEIAQRPFDDGRVTKEIETLKQKADNLSKINERLQAVAKGMEIQIAKGLRPERIDNYQTHWARDVTTKTISNSTTDGKSASVSHPPTGGGTGTDGVSGSVTNGTDTATGATYLANPNYVNLDQARIAADRAENDYIEVNLKAQEADIRTKETLERLQIAKDALSKNQQLVAEQLAALTIKAGAKGKLSLSVAEGVFVKKRARVGEHSDMNSNDVPQDPKGYYYAPLTEGGPFQTKLEEYFSNAGMVINAAIAVGKGVDPPLAAIPSNAGSKVGRFLGNTVGFYIDNLSNILMNANTFLEQANDANSWMMPAEDALRVAKAKAAEDARRVAKAKAAEEARRVAKAKAAKQAGGVAKAKPAEEARGASQKRPPKKRAGPLK